MMPTQIKSSQSGQYPATTTTINTNVPVAVTPITPMAPMAQMTPMAAVAVSEQQGDQQEKSTLGEVKDAVQGAVDTVKNAGQAATGAVSTGAKVTSNVAQTAPGILSDSLKGGFNRASEIGKQAAEGAMETGVNAQHAASETMNNVMSTASTVTENLLSETAAAATMVGNVAGNAAHTTSQAASSIVGTLANAASGVVSTVVGTVNEVFQEMNNATQLCAEGKERNIPGEIQDKAVEATMKVTNKAQDIAHSIKGTALETSELAGQVLQSAPHIASEAVNSLVGTAANVAGNALDLAGGAIDTVESIGGKGLDIGREAVGGITSTAESLAAAATKNTSLETTTGRGQGGPQGGQQGVWVAQGGGQAGQGVASVMIPQATQAPQQYLMMPTGMSGGVQQMYAPPGAVPVVQGGPQQVYATPGLGKTIYVQQPASGVTGTEE